MIRSSDLTSNYLESKTRLNGIHLNSFSNTKNPIRIGSMSFEAIIFDLCYCIITNEAKREKRLKRLNLIVEIYNQIYGNLCSSLNDAIIQTNFVDIGDDESLTTEKLLEILHRQLNGEQTSINVKKHFSAFCTNTINKDGDVYDVMTKIAIIAFDRLLLNASSFENDVCTFELLKGAQLIFKGGCAIGKFLFQFKHADLDNKSIWDVLEQNKKDFIMSSFIKGGDNDTSIYFENIKLLSKIFDKDSISNSIKIIAATLSQILSDVCLEFDLSNMLLKHSSNLCKNSKFLLGDQECTFTSRESKGFHIDMNVLEPYINREQSQVFLTHSFVQFDMSKEKIAKFELVRVKLGFSSSIDNMLIKTYSELLDVSLIHYESHTPFPKDWVPIQ
jgi:hypothetical protein